MHNTLHVCQLAHVQCILRYRLHNWYFCDRIFSKKHTMKIVVIKLSSLKIWIKCFLLLIKMLCYAFHLEKVIKFWNIAFQSYYWTKTYPKPYKSHPIFITTFWKITRAFPLFSMININTFKNNVIVWNGMKKYVYLVSQAKGACLPGTCWLWCHISTLVVWLKA